VPRVRYRAGQVRWALAARVRPPDDTAARRILPEALLGLFDRMPPADRAHGLSVLADLVAAGETDPVVLQAALLHDAGKSDGGVTLLHRTARVLLARRLPWVWRWLADRPSGWHRPFWVVANHPERGAAWVADLGGTPDLVDIIRYHESPAPRAWAGSPQDRRHAVLTYADTRL
jgi:hypothetical protein